MRTYAAALSDTDDGSQIEGLAWSVSAGRFEASALAGDGFLLGNNGLIAMVISTNGQVFSESDFGQLPLPPCEIADVIYNTFTSRWFAVGYWDPATWGSQPYGVWNSPAGSSWSRISRATTATFDCSVCIVLAGASIASIVVGGELHSGTGRLIGRSTGGAFSAISTPIDNQFFRVTQIASHPTTGFLVAALKPVGVVSSVERIMSSSDGGVTWVLRSSGLDGDAGYGVCWNASLAQWLVTGTQGLVTSTNGTTWTSHLALGVDTQGKPCEAGSVTIIPGGSSNTVSEWDGASLGSQTLTGIITIKAAAYSPALDVVCVGGLGNPSHSLWYSLVVSNVVPTVNARFDLG